MGRLLAVVGVAVALGIGALTLAVVSRPPALEESVEKIQGALKEVLIAKSIGDEIMGRSGLASRNSSSAEGAILVAAGKEQAAPGMPEVADRAGAALGELEDLDPPSELGAYHGAVRDWASDVRETAQAIAAGSLSGREAAQAWSGLPSEPPRFTTGLGGGESAAVVVATSLNQIRAARAAGDRAVAGGDRGGARGVAASLQAESYLLRNVCGGTGRSGPFAPCSRRMTRILPSLYRSAWGYAARKPAAGERWIEGSKAAAPIIAAAEEEVRRGVGPGPPGPEEPPWFEDAVRRCRALGGRVERGPGSYAFTCVYSTRRATRCLLEFDEEGRPTPDPDPRCTPGAPPPAPGGVSAFDGTYRGRIQATFSISAAGQTFGYPLAFPITFTVSDGRIGGDLQGVILDRSGRGRVTFSAAAGGASVEVTEVVQFSRTDGGVSVEGVISGSFSGQEGVTGTIRGTLEAHRVSP